MNNESDYATVIRAAKTLDLAFRKAAALDCLEENKSDIWRTEGQWFLSFGSAKGSKTLLELAEAAMKAEKEHQP